MHSYFLALPSGRVLVAEDVPDGGERCGGERSGARPSRGGVWLWSLTRFIPRWSGTLMARGATGCWPESESAVNGGWAGWERSRFMRTASRGICFTSCSSPGRSGQQCGDSADRGNRRRMGSRSRPCPTLRTWWIITAREAGLGLDPRVVADLVPAELDAARSQPTSSHGPEWSPPAVPATLGEAFREPFFTRQPGWRASAFPGQAYAGCRAEQDWAGGNFIKQRYRKPGRRVHLVAETREPRYLKSASRSGMRIDDTVSVTCQVT